MANEEVGNLVARVSMDQTNFQEGISRLNRQMKLIQSEFQAASAKLGNFGKSTDGLKLKADALTKQLEVQRARIQTLETAYQKSVDTKGKDATATQNLEIKLNKARAEMAKMEAELKKTNAEIAKQESAWTKLSNACETIGPKMAKVGKTFTTHVSVPMAALGGIAVKTAVDMESAFAGIEKTVDATEEQLKELEQGFKEMSKEIPLAAEELMGIGEAAGQLGIQTENILGFSEVMAKLGVTTNLSAHDAAMALARLANIMQMPQDQFDRLGATIVDLGNNLATTEREIVEMGLRLAGAGNQAKMSEADILAIAGALSSVGIEAEAGGTAFSRVMLKINNHVMSGGEKLKIFAAVAGMTADQFAAQWRENAAQALAAFINGLGQMQQSGQNVVPVLEQLGLNEIRVRDALLRASGASDLFANSLELANEAWEKNIALDVEAEKRFATTASMWQKTINQLKLLAAAFGEILLPIINNFLENTLTPLIERLSGMSDGMKKAILVVSGLAIVIPPLIWGLGSFLALIPLMTAGLAKLSGAIAAVGTAMKTLVANPIGLLITAIAAVIAAVVLLYKAWTNNWGGIRDKTEAVLSLLSAYIDKFVANVAISFTFLKSKVFDIINSILDKVAPLAKLLPDSISGAFDKLRDSLKDKSEDVKDQLDSLQRISAEASERIADSMGKVKEAFSSKEDMSVGGFRFKAGEAGLSGEKDVLSDLEEALAKVDNQAWFTADSLDALNDTAKKAAKAAEETRAAWEIATDILSAKLQTVRAQQETAIITTEIAGEKTKALADKIIYLRRQHELQSQIVAVVNEAYQESVAAKGEDAEESVKLAARLAQEQQAQAELEKQIHETTQALKDQAQELRDLAAEVEKVEKKYKDDLAEAYDEYYQKRKEVNRKLAEDEKNLTLQFEQELAKRAQSLANFVGLFEEVTQRQVSGEQLLKNLQDQVATFEEWQENIAKLAARGVDEGLIEELREMGPKAAPEIAALNTLTDEQLTQYVALWRQRNEAARNEAVEQLEKQRAEMQKKLAEIRRDATAQLNEYRKEWEQKTAQIRQNAEEEMQKIEEKMKQVAVSSTGYGQSIMDNFVGGIESRFERLRETLESMAKMVDDYMPHSPARRGPLSKLNEYGPALVQGIADGIKRSMNKLESVVAQMAALTPGAMRPALAASYNTSNNNYGGNTIYINITGAGGNPRQIADDLMRELRKRGVRF